MMSMFMGKGGFGHKGKGHHKPNDEAHIQKVFELNEEDFSKFKASKAKHIEVTAKLNQDLKDLSSQYYQTTLEPLRDSLLDSIMEVSEQIYLANSQHLSELRQLVTSGKEKQLERFIHHLVQGESTRGKHKKGPPPRH